jgi:hypothetical protein
MEEYKLEATRHKHIIIEDRTLKCMSCIEDCDEQ